MDVNVKKIENMEKIILKNKNIYPIDDFLKTKRGEEMRVERENNKWKKIIDEKTIDIVVKTILSQNTSDSLRDIAFESLKKRYRNLMKILEEDGEKIEDIIRVCGLPKVKTKRIKNALEVIKNKLERPSDLCKMKKDEAFQFLTSISGIGPKSAEVILAFACGHDTFPVDTHVSRIIRRLGIADGSRERIYKLVSPHVKNKILTHVFLIHHGRRVCLARKPKCDICVFTKICDYFENLNSYKAPFS